MESTHINKNRFFVWAVIITLLNPVFAGLLLGIWMMGEPDLRKEGRIVTGFAIVWGLLALLLISKFGSRLGV